MTKRQSIYVEGFGHKNPIPAACRLGNILMSGIVFGLDPATGKAAPTLEEQCALMFRHIRAIMAEAGGSTDDIVKITVWMSDRSQRAAVNKEWLDMFPDPATRPARQAMAADLDGGKLVQCDFMAVMGS
jgi:2-iminobutanoate/2-iminopropanoate deaminase